MDKTRTYPMASGLAAASKMRALDGIERNKDLDRLATRIMLVQEWASQWKEDKTVSFEERTLRVDDMFQKEQQAMNRMYDSAVTNIEQRIKAAKTQLFETQGLTAGQSELQMAVLQKYENSSPNEQVLMMDNENTGRILNSLVGNGLLPESVKNVLNKKHSPEAYATVGQGRNDAEDLATLSSEFKTCKNLNWDESQAAQIRSSQYKPMDA